MPRFDCPVLDAVVMLDSQRVLSTHRTARGRVAYGRCVCGGLVVMAGDREGGWEVTSHAGGSTVEAAADGVSPMAAADCA